MAVIRQEKVEAVAQIKERIESAKALFFANFRGLSVTDVSKLRKSLTQSDSSAVVCKNTLARIALSEMSIEFPSEFLIGPSMIVGAYNDAAQTSKVLTEFAKEKEAFGLKGGILDRVRILTPNDIAALAKLPSRDELIAQVARAMKAPITNFHSATSGPIRGLVYALKAVQEKK